MTLPAAFAFLHHIAAFAIAAALSVQFLLISEPLTLQRARQLQVADIVVGASAGAVLVVGLLRLFYFEKGASYYAHSVPFIAKMSLFVLVAVLSIYPTAQFLSWRKEVRQRQTPVVSERKRRAIRAVIKWELIGVVLLILCAALMAKGVGSFA